MCLDWIRRLGGLESPLFTGTIWGESSADRRLSAFPMLRRVIKTDDGKTNVHFSGSRGSPKAGPTLPSIHGEREGNGDGAGTSR